MKIALNIIGILIFFLSRFSGRTDKSKEPDLKFWLKDNWEELTAIALFDIGLILLVFDGGFNLNFERFPSLPEWVQLGGDSAVCFAVGLVVAWKGYEWYNQIIKSKRK